jgi:hypothetical protein
VWPNPTKRASGWQSFAIVALSFCLPPLANAADAESARKQAGEDRWVPSLAITAGVTAQRRQEGSAASFIQDTDNPTFPVPTLREGASGDDTAVSPFVGGAFELMAPALPIPTRPRFFIGGEFLPTFAPGRDLAIQGDPKCVRGPEAGVPCARDEDGSRRRPFGEDSLNGVGSKLEARLGTSVFAAHIGAAFPFAFGKRQFRIKPSFGWINFKVSSFGLVVDGACDPTPPENGACTDYTPIIGGTTNPGFLRETRLAARDSKRFNGIGPGLDLEMDTGQFGPFGVSIFVGGRAYVILDDREMSFEATETFNDQLGNDQATARFEAEIDRWMYRAHVGVRLQFIGYQP